MGMKRKSRIGLQLLPQLASPSTSEFCTHDHSLKCSSTRKQITIFHHAQAGVYDKSELQAIAILWLARTKMMKPSNLGTPDFQLMHRPNGFSLKKSLHKFLQKRRDRIKQSLYQI